MVTREFRHSYSKRCEHCDAGFTSWNRCAKYCSGRCRSNSASKRRLRTCKGDWLTIPRACKACGTEFLCTRETGPNKKYCSPKCSVSARRGDYRAFLATNPDSMRDYNRARTRKHGKDTLSNRLRKRYPDMPEVCEAGGCNESRVVEIAHRPEFKRNGAWRTMDLYERHMFWVLCPTCHRVLDREIETPEQLGLT